MGPGLAVYRDAEIELEIRLDESEETVWLTQKQIADLFGTARSTITEHISAIYREEELEASSTCRKFRQVQSEGGRSVSREIEHYNLDMVLSVGYRVSSKRATRFRQWATRILKAYIVSGSAANQVLLEKLGQIEARLTDHDEKLALVFEGLRQMLTAEEAPRKIGFRTE